MLISLKLVQDLKSTESCNWGFLKRMYIGFCQSSGNITWKFLSTKLKFWSCAGPLASDLHDSVCGEKIHRGLVPDCDMHVPTASWVDYWLTLLGSIEPFCFMALSTTVLLTFPSGQFGFPNSCPRTVWVIYPLLCLYFVFPACDNAMLCT